MATDYAILPAMKRLFCIWFAFCLAIGLAVGLSACGDDFSSSAGDLSSSSEDPGSADSRTLDCQFDVDAKFWEFGYTDGQGKSNIVHYLDQDSVLFVEHFVSTKDDEEQCGILGKSFADMYYVYSDSLCFFRLGFTINKRNEDGSFGPSRMSKAEHMDVFAQNCLASRDGKRRNPEKPFGNTPGYDPEYVDEFFGDFTE